MSFTRRKLLLWLAVIPLWISIFLAFPKISYACTKDGVIKITRVGTCYQAQCRGVNVTNPTKYWASTEYDYGPGIDRCWQTDYYDTADCGGPISDYTCSDNCTPDANGRDPAKCGNAVCANGNLNGTDVCNGVTGWNSQPAWCQDYKCGYFCQASATSAPTCTELRPPNGGSAPNNSPIYKQGADYGLSACQSVCVAPTPPPNYTCTGNDSDGQPLSCQNGNSCPSGYKRASDTTKTCAPNSICCSPVVCNYPPTTDVDCDVPVNETNPPCTVGKQNKSGTKPPCPPTAEPTCPVGENKNGLLYSCQNSCLASSGYYPSSRTCSSGQSCCFTPTAILPPVRSGEGYCNVRSALSTGTNSGKASVGRYGFDRIDWYLSKNGAAPIFHHTTDVTTGSANDDVIDKSTTFSNLTANTTYKVTAKGWCQNCGKFSRNCLGEAPFTTWDPNDPNKYPRPTTPPTLQCWGGYQMPFGQVARWVNGTGTGVQYTPNFNLRGSSGYKAGEGCWRPGVGVEEPPQAGTLGGKIYVVNSCTPVASLVNNTATLTQPADFGNVLYWVWSTQSNGGPMCVLNNGQFCQLQDGSLNYVSQSNILLGTIQNNDAAPLYSGNSVSLISWDSTRFKPIGYYRYQKSVGNNCFNGPNGVECPSHECRPIDDPQTREFYYWGGWACDGCTGPPGFAKPAMSNSFYPNPDAPYCLTNDPAPANAIGNINPNARIDFVFQDVGGIFGDVTGYVYFDTNKNGVQDGGETTGVAGVTINLSGVGSTQTNEIGHYSFTNVPAGDYSLSALSPEGYKLTSPESKNVTVGCTSLPAQNFMARASYYIKGVVKNDLDLNGTCIDSDPTFAGTVSLYNLIANRQPISLSGKGDYIFDDLPIPQSPGATYTYQVTADPGIGVSYSRIVTVPPSHIEDFCIMVPEPWVESLNGDVHSNTEIDLPKGVSP